MNRVIIIKPPLRVPYGAPGGMALYGLPEGRAKNETNRFAGNAPAGPSMISQLIIFYYIFLRFASP